MKIAFGVFDWGLGHATRDIPLIEALLAANHKVDIISTGRALIFLQKKFGDKCGYFDVPSIYVPYPKNGFFIFNFTRNIPKMLINISRARQISKVIITSGKYDKVISDCRYDVYDKVSNSYLINHQLRFRTPLVEKVTERWLYVRAKKYKYILVPDYDGHNLSGKLSHGLAFVPKNKIKYVGILSHLTKKKAPQDIDYFVSLSGPEPQRTILEQKILLDVNKLKGRIVITLGKPEACTVTKSKNVTIYSFLDSKQQENMMNRAKCIISRSGYTTVMDLVELDKKKVLFIPTPGQTEQEYLGKIYSARGYFHCINQKKFNLVHDIKQVESCKGYAAAWKTKSSVKRILQLIELEV